MNNKNREIKENNRNRFVYSFFFIGVLVLISIMYASLAINIGVKVKVPKIIKPIDNPDTHIEEKKQEPVSPKRPTKKVKKVVPTVPVIIPNNINWDIEFNNLNVKDGSISAVTEAYILSSKTEIYYEVIFTTPGEFYSFDMDVVNKGNVDAKIYDIIETGITDDVRRYLDYKVTYDDGTEISKNDVLASRKKKKILVSLKFKEDINPEDLPDGGKDFKLTYKIIYVQK